MSSNDFFKMKNIVKQYVVGEEVQTILKGIGENAAVRKIFAARAAEAYEALLDAAESKRF